ncbi:MAG: GNAT family N-acetyltransferase [Acidobacteria bacterium]|nr:GNAT family N-acetyltransferase [Acidobacteriota bacterium]
MVTLNALENDVLARLMADPAWAVYALADLEPALASHCLWVLPEARPASVALLYCAFDTPIFWTSATPAELAPFAGDLFRHPALILQIQPGIVPLIENHYHHVQLHPMWRMSLSPRDFQPAAPAPADRRLLPADLPALEALYADGLAASEQPDFFHPHMLSDGLFYGAFEAGELVAAAGTHVLSSRFSAAAIGNVYTRRDSRRRGHASRLTSLVAAGLYRSGAATIALSVRRENPAFAVYRALGFRPHCEFFEGHASR